MDSHKKEIDSEKEEIRYPLNKNKFIGKKTIKTKNYNILSNIQNPSISHFNINSHFIYSEKDFIEYFNTLNNKNLVKLNQDERKNLSNKIKEITLISNIDGINDFIEIDEILNNKINSFKLKNNKTDEVIDFIKSKIINSNNRANISCRKLCALYLQEKGRFVCKSTIHNIIKNKLGYHYLKTCKKSNFLKTDLGIFSCLTFIKIIYKSLVNGFDLIFVDESTVRLNNSSFKCWRHYSEQIYFGKNNSGKINLILSVTKNEIFHYQLIEENTNSTIFLNFMKSLNDKIKKMKEKNYILIMDNCTIHKSEDLIKYYKDEKINIIFNVQYCSFFNCVELCFRALKKALSYKLLENKDDIRKEIDNFFKKDEIKSTLLKNYNETLKHRRKII